MSEVSGWDINVFRALVVYDLGVLKLLKHSRTENYIWRFGIIQKYLSNLSVLLVWFLWPQVFQYPQIIYYWRTIVDICISRFWKCYAIIYVTFHSMYSQFFLSMVKKLKNEFFTPGLWHCISSLHAKYFLEKFILIIFFMVLA